MADPFWYKEFDLNVCEYESSSVSKVGGHAKKVHGAGLAPLSGKIKFSLFRLCVALAKSILTQDPLDDDLVKEVRAGLYMLDSMLDCSSADLRLTSNFRRKYRDFSKAARIGELAQATAFIFAQEILRYPLVMDYHGYLESQSIHPINEDLRSPDFALLFRSGTGKPSLLESKGASPSVETHAVKTKLRDALDQCLTGQSHIIAHAKPYHGVDRSFGTYLLASQSSDTWPGQLAFCDPENDIGGDMRDPVSAARRYYSAFLLIAGQREMSSRLLHSESFDEDVRQAQREVIGNVEYLVFKPTKNFNLFTPLLAAKPGAPYRKLPDKWFLRKDILESIISKDRDELMRLMSLLSSTESFVRDNEMHFTDGTICRISD